MRWWLAPGPLVTQAVPDFHVAALLVTDALSLHLGCRPGKAGALTGTALPSGSLDHVGQVGRG